MEEYIDEYVASPEMSTITVFPSTSTTPLPSTSTTPLPSTSYAISSTPSKQARIDLAFSKLKSFQGM